MGRLLRANGQIVGEGSPGGGSAVRSHPDRRLAGRVVGQVVTLM